MEKIIRYSTSVLTSILSAFFIEIIWHYKSIPFLAIDHGLILLIAIPIIFLILIYVATKSNQKNIVFDKKNRLITGIYLIGVVSFLLLINVIFGDQGPWKLRRDARWLDSMYDYKPGFDITFGIYGLIVTYSSWLVVNLNLGQNKKVRYFGVILFLILLVLIYMALKSPKPGFIG